MSLPTLEVRCARQDEIDRYGVNASEDDGAFILLVGGEAVAITDEYGTARLLHPKAPEHPNTRRAVEDLVDNAGYILAQVTS